jgi:hypothetical protein
MHSKLKRSAGYKTAEHCKKYQICMQDKLHAGQYSHFPWKELRSKDYLMTQSFFIKNKHHEVKY